MKILLIGLLTTILSACSSIQHISDNKDAWIVEKYPIGDAIFYCKSNEDKEGRVNPTCYQARMADRGARIGIINPPPNGDAKKEGK